MSTTPALRDFDHFRIAGRTFGFTTLEHVSEAYTRTIGAMDLGMRDSVPDCAIFDGAGEQVARVSYNGRVWGVDDGFTQYDQLLYDPSGSYCDPQDNPACYFSQAAFERSMAARGKALAA